MSPHTCMRSRTHGKQTCGHKLGTIQTATAEDTLPAQGATHACAAQEVACSHREATPSGSEQDAGPSATAYGRTMMPSNLAAMKASPAQHTAMPVY